MQVLLDVQMLRCLGSCRMYIAFHDHPSLSQKSLVCSYECAVVAGLGQLYGLNSYLQDTTCTHSESIS